MPDMEFSQEMKMQQTLSPQLYQSLEILQMPLMDLQNFIKQEISANPTLEIQGPEPDLNIELESGSSDSDDFDKELIALGDDWESGASTYSSQTEEKYQYMMDSLSESVSLNEKLMNQLGLISLNKDDYIIAESIVGNIDDDGYLQLDINELNSNPNFPFENFERILGIIQSFEPAGIAARDLKECLLLQLDRKGELKSNAGTLVSNHLDLLSRNRLQDIAKEMNLTLEEVKILSQKIAKLDPKPGQQLNEDQIEYITPEIFVRKINGKYVVQANRKPYPNLFINQNYLRLLKDKNTPNDTKQYIREKLSKSRLIIQSIDQRLSIVERVAIELVRIQQNFFDEGIPGLKPLNMKTVADNLGVHETTVSRASSGKYMQTPKGLYDMKYFYKTGVKTISGTTISNEYAKKVLSDLINEEDKYSPHSDQVLVQLLKKYDIVISRRTVAKYRDQLGILASNLRREI